MVELRGQTSEKLSLINHTLFAKLNHFRQNDHLSLILARPKSIGPVCAGGHVRCRH